MVEAAVGAVQQTLLAALVAQAVVRRVRLVQVHRQLHRTLLLTPAVVVAVLVEALRQIAGLEVTAVPVLLVSKFHQLITQNSQVVSPSRPIHQSKQAISFTK